MRYGNEVYGLIYKIKKALYKLALKATPYANKPIFRHIKKSLAPLLRTKEYRKRVPYEPGAYPCGVNLLGYLKAQMGLGQGARLYAKAIISASVPHAFLNTTVGNPSRHNDNELNGMLSSSFRYNTNIIHVNAEQMPLLYSSYPEAAWNKRYNIGVWLWELESLPEEWQNSFRYLDEIWTPSTFTSQSVQRTSPLPVTTIPYGIEAAVDLACTRETFGLPKDAFLFLCMYDVNSLASRKNPIGAINAFCEAFTKENTDVGLVIKVNNPKPDDIEAIRRQSHGYNNIHIIPSVLEKCRVNALIGLCDVLVSLHRSEGFGLVIAEAMLLGTPVVATNWSANTDFMNSGNSCPVDYRLVDVDKGYYMAKSGQRWAEPEIGHAAAYMQRLFNDGEFKRYISDAGRRTIQEDFSVEKSAKKMKQRLQDLGLLQQ